MYVCIYIYIYMYVCIYIYIYMYVCMYVCMYNFYLNKLFILLKEIIMIIKTHVKLILDMYNLFSKFYCRERDRPLVMGN